MPPKIIGIAGTNGSGKDTLGQILEQDHNYLFVSVSDMLRHELKAQGLPLSRDDMRKLSSKWRKSYGLGVMIDKARAEYERLGGDKSFKGLAIASLRNPAEADAVHAHGGKVVWLDGDPKLRYERIHTNTNKRGADREADDNMSFEQFLSVEAIEMAEGGNSDPTALHMSGVKAKSDLFLINDSHELAVLRELMNQQLGFSAP